jgi:hypothetical protein
MWLHPDGARQPATGMRRRAKLRWRDLGRGQLAPDCDDCLEHLQAEKMLLDAFASADSRQGRSTYELARRYFEYYHEQGHRSD